MTHPFANSSDSSPFASVLEAARQAKSNQNSQPVNRKSSGKQKLEEAFAQLTRNPSTQA